MKTTLYGLVFAIALLLQGCGAETASNAEITQLTTGCTKAEVLFLGNSQNNQSDYLATTVTTQAQMSQLASYVSGDSVEANDCKIDGKVIFYEVDQVKVTLEFSLQEQCVWFSYVLNGQTLTKKMTHKGKLYLNELLQGASQQWQSRM